MRLALSTQTFRFIPSLALAALAVSASPSAHAHIVLMNPPSWVVEGPAGDPQKTGPCGGTVGTAGLTPTNTVTTYTAGETIMVTWKETVGHPGHFRISLTAPGESRDVLVDPPVVTENGDGVSGNSISASFVPDGTRPVLMDHLFPRENVAANMPQAAPFTQAITLPDEPCEKCTLQVIQFMSQHTPGYFYHHCADIKIVEKDNAAAAGTGGSSAVGAAGSASISAGGSSSTGAGGTSSSAGSSSVPGGDDDGEDDSGCSLGRATPSRSTSALAALALIGLATSWRRRRSAR